jgi:hypothetical protein
MNVDSALRDYPASGLPTNDLHRSNRLTAVATIAAALTLGVAVSADMAQAQQPPKPNIVFIMTDDVGWGDLGSYGGGVMRGAPTPNLDRIAAEGMRFVNYYGQASCTAGRASFITGRIPIRTALSLVLVPGDPDHLTPDTPTVAQFLKARSSFSASDRRYCTAVSARRCAIRRHRCGRA